MGYFSDQDIERQEKAAADKAFVVMDHQDMRARQGADRCVDRRRHEGCDIKSCSPLGAVIAEEAYCLNTRLHGVMHARPSVFIEDEETVRVTYKTARPRTVAILAKNLKLAKKLAWPKGLGVR